MEENEVSEGLDTTDEQEVIQEKMLPQSQVNKIVASAKAQAAESARRAAEEKYQRELENMNAARSQGETRQTEIPEDMYQRVTERLNKELQQQRHNEHVTQVANNYRSKIEHGKAAYEDFDEVTKEFNPIDFPHVTYLLAGLDNPADVLYELMSHPSKLAEIDSFAVKGSPIAEKRLLKLSASIKDNRDAVANSNSKRVNEPLDRLQPSKVSGSNGKMGIRDLRNQDWLRG